MDYINKNDAIIQLSHNKNGNDDCDIVVQRDIETIKALRSPCTITTQGGIVTVGFVTNKCDTAL